MLFRNDDIFRSHELVLDPDIPEPIKKLFTAEFRKRCERLLFIKYAHLGLIAAANTSLRHDDYQFFKHAVEVENRDIASISKTFRKLNQKEREDWFLEEQENESVAGTVTLDFDSI